MKLLKSNKARWDERGEAFSQMILLGGDPTDKEIQREYSSGRCGHEHDCCGCVTFYTSHVRRLRDGMVAVRIYGIRNI